MKREIKCGCFISGIFEDSSLDVKDLILEVRCSLTDLETFLLIRRRHVFSDWFTVFALFSRRLEDLVINVSHVSWWQCLRQRCVEAAAYG